MTYRKIDRAEAFRRWENQMDPALKMELADDILFNDGSLEELELSLRNYLMKLGIRT
jgi:dephospho-CoA kinase